MKVLQILLYFSLTLSALGMLDVLIPKKREAVTVTSVGAVMKKVSGVNRSYVSNSGENYSSFTRVELSSGHMIPLSNTQWDEVAAVQAGTLYRSRVLGQSVKLVTAEGEQAYWAIRGLYTWWALVPGFMMLFGLLGYRHRKDMKKLANTLWPNFLLILFSFWLLFYAYLS